MGVVLLLFGPLLIVLIFTVLSKSSALKRDPSTDLVIVVLLLLATAIASEHIAAVMVPGGCSNARATYALIFGTPLADLLLGGFLFHMIRGRKRKD